MLLLPPTLKKATPRLMLFPRVITLLLHFLISFSSPPAPIQTTDVILPALGGGRSKGQLIQLALCTSATLKYSSEYYSTSFATEAAATASGIVGKNGLISHAHQGSAHFQIMRLSENDVMGIW